MPHMTKTLSNLLPIRHFTTYERNGYRYFATWRQWGSRIWSHTAFPVAPAFDTPS